MMSRMKFDGPVDSAGVAPASGSNVFIFLYCHASISMARLDAFSDVFAAENFEGFKQRRRGFAAADSHADRLEHLTGLDFQVIGCVSQRRFEPACVNSAVREHLPCPLEHPQRHRGIAFLRNQLRRIVGCEFVDEEEVGDRSDVVQHPDALPNQRRDLQHLLRVDIQAGGLQRKAAVASTSSSTGMA